MQAAGGAGTVTYQKKSTSDITFKIVEANNQSAAQPNNSCTNASGASQTPTGYTYGLCAGVTIGSSTKNYAVYSKITTKTCPTGYTQKGENCALTSPTQVQKPADSVPCEVIKNADGSWQTDTSNPACTDLQADLSIAGDTVVYTRSQGDYDQVTSNSDGSVEIITRGAGGNRDIKTHPYTLSAGGYPIESITDLTPPQPLAVAAAARPLAAEAPAAAQTNRPAM